MKQHRGATAERRKGRTREGRPDRGRGNQRVPPSFFMGRSVDTSRLERVTDCEWRIPRRAGMRVPGILYATEDLVRGMDDKVVEQVTNVARLPGIVAASLAMPDAHWGYGFPIGGVAAFDPDEGGVVSAGGVGFDISCGVRCLYTGLKTDDIRRVQKELADMLYYKIPDGC